MSVVLCVLKLYRQYWHIVFLMFRDIVEFGFNKQLQYLEPSTFLTFF